mmetsp:Transcript_4321/g.10389  ORF Transcript_4321/g.10389 Transcript_4321/m.10389 type:complete len:267 (-) Transcript_4321:204-1004(-)
MVHGWRPCRPRVEPQPASSEPEVQIATTPAPTATAATLASAGSTIAVLASAGAVTISRRNDDANGHGAATLSWERLRFCCARRRWTRGQARARGRLPALLGPGAWRRLFRARRGRAGEILLGGAGGRAARAWGPRTACLPHRASGACAGRAADVSSLCLRFTSCDGGGRSHGDHTRVAACRHEHLEHCIFAGSSAAAAHRTRLPTREPSGRGGEDALGRPSARAEASRRSPPSSDAEVVLGQRRLRERGRDRRRSATPGTGGAAGP